MNLFPSFAIRFGLLTAGAIAFAAGTSLRAVDEPAGNIATADNGAYIIYSTPLKGGASANFLTQDGSRQLNFASQAGSKLIVLDLGKTYALGSVRLKFKHPVKFEVFVLNSKPDGGDWNSVLSGKPDFVSDSAGLQELLKGQQGRFIVFVTEGDPGPFYGLYVTGIYIPYPNGGGALVEIYHPHGPFDGGNEGGLPECPFPYKDYFPPVFPPSP